MTKRQIINIVSKFVIYFVLIVVSFVYLQPIIEMLVQSFMSTKDMVDPSVTWVPKSLTLNNLKYALTCMKMPKSLWDSVWFSGLLAILQTFVASLAGFALSRYNFKGKQFWFVMMLLAFILPTPVLMVPRFMGVKAVGELLGKPLIGTIWPQVAMALLGQGVNSTVLVLIFYTAFNMIPKALDEAAEIDGASILKVYWFIVVRMSTSTILVVFLFAFVWNWNETYITNTFLGGGGSNIHLVPSMLSVFDSEFSANISAGSGAFKINGAFKKAATLISITPLLVLYIFVQKWFIQGIENTGITGE